MLIRLREFLNQPFNPKMHRIAGVLLIMLSPLLLWGYFLGLYGSFLFRIHYSNIYHEELSAIQTIIILVSLLFAGRVLCFLFKTIAFQFHSVKQISITGSLRSEGKRLLYTILLLSLSNFPVTAYFAFLFCKYANLFVTDGSELFLLSFFPLLLYLFHLAQVQQEGRTLSKAQVIIRKIGIALLLLYNLDALWSLGTFLSVFARTL